MEARHSFIRWGYLVTEAATGVTYVAGPLVTYLLSDDPKKRLRTPTGLRDPFPDASAFSRALCYPLYSLSALFNVFFVLHSGLIVVLLFDSARTLFQLSALSFQRVDS